jgi:hypothetical protein
MQIQNFQVGQESQLGCDFAVQIVVRESQPVEVRERPNGCGDRATETVVIQFQ